MRSFRNYTRNSEIEDVNSKKQALETLNTSLLRGDRHELQQVETAFENK